MAKTIRDRDGKRVTRDIRPHEDIRGDECKGVIWGVNVWHGGANGFVASLPGGPELRRFYYATRDQARNADISDDIGQHGRVA